MFFVKMQGCGNSYLFFDLRSGRSGEDIVKRTPALCHSKFGVGGDGVVLLLPHKSAFCAMEIYNADGSRAKLCGNALRCVGHLFFDRLPFFVATDSGPVWLQQKCGGVGVLLSPPRTVKTVGQRDVLVDVGNKHLVSFLPCLGESAVKSRAGFARSRDINFMAVACRGGSVFEMRCFERGSGETLSCGSGACAAAAALWHTGKGGQDTSLQFLCRGGALQVQKDDRGLWLLGDCGVVFRGKF